MIQLPNTLHKTRGQALQLFYSGFSDASYHTAESAAGGVYPMADRLRYTSDAGQTYVTINERTFLIRSHEARPVNKTVLLVGDSIISRGVIGQRLRDTDPSLTVLEDGRGGWKAFDFVHNNVEFPAADITIFHLGINDVFGHKTDESAEAAAASSAAYIKQLFDRVGQCAVALPIGCADSQDGFAIRYNTQQHLKRYKANRRALLAEYLCLGVPLIATNAAVDPLHDWPVTFVDNREMINDPIHPADSGMHRAADMIYSYLLSMTSEASNAFLPYIKRG